MPNHCESDLYVSGKADGLKAFHLHAISGEVEDILDANKYIPYPQEYKDQDELVAKAREAARDGSPDLVKAAWALKDGFNSGGYKWCIEHWGTKWGIYSAAVCYKNEITAKYTFQSAWSSPEPVIKAMSTMFPLLTFKLKWYECGMAQKGMYIYQNGDVRNKTFGPYTGNRGG